MLWICSLVSSCHHFCPCSIMMIQVRPVSIGGKDRRSLEKSRSPWLRKNVITYLIRAAASTNISFFQIRYSPPALGRQMSKRLRLGTWSRAGSGTPPPLSRMLRHRPQLGLFLVLVTTEVSLRAREHSHFTDEETRNQKAAVTSPASCTPSTHTLQFSGSCFGFLKSVTFQSSSVFLRILYQWVFPCLNSLTLHGYLLLHNPLNPVTMPPIPLSKPYLDINPITHSQNAI